VRGTKIDMKHKAFTNIIAHSTRVPEKTVSMFARNLKSAGLLTSGARGVNAPEMTVLDLTRMATALCATDRPSDAVEMLNRYRVARSTKSATIQAGKRDVEIPKGTDLEDLLSNLLDLPFSHLRKLNLCLFIHWNRLEAELLIGDTLIIFKAKLTDDEEDSQARGSFPGISTTRSLGSHELIEMALPFYLEKQDGTTWEDMTASGTAAKVAERHIFGVKDE